MKPLSFLLAIAFSFSACAPANPRFTENPAQSVHLTTAQKTAIGKKIWQNECGGTVEGLTSWNAGEEFPSLGIGHFIWYPAGFDGRFEESWPSMVAFAERQGVKLPAVAKLRHSPWNTPVEFRAKFQSNEMVALRSWLAAHVNLQTDFIIARSRAALPKILSAAPAAERARISENYRKVSTTPQGTYALIDYVNFKGDGTSPTEKYKGQGWGMLQVLGGMNNVSDGPAAAVEFAASAKRALNRRIDNSPPERGENRWRIGWENRCSTYARPL